MADKTETLRITRSWIEWHPNTQKYRVTTTDDGMQIEYLN